MASAKKTYDIFISHAPADAAFAARLASACRANGLEVLTNQELPVGADWSDVLWEALSESRGLLAIVSPNGPTPSMGIEIGAARAWNKPIFAVVTHPTTTHLPSLLADVRVYPPGRIEDVIREVKASGAQLTEADKEILATILADLRASVDELALNPRQLQKLVARFKVRAGWSVPGERLLSELLRMRKQGLLTKGRLGGRSKPHRSSA